MTPFVFDTLSASKQLREAGMAEGVAEAVEEAILNALCTVNMFGFAANKR